MRPVPFGKLMEWILKESNDSGSIFSVRSIYSHKGSKLSFLGEELETPFGPAAGPHTQLAQNIISAYAAGARFFELKTVQVIDGEDLPVSKPCIDARDECYNVEWSTELTVGEAFDEYVKAWFALKLISAEFDLGDSDGFVFNMSVGYDLKGIKSEKIDDFIEGLKDASGTSIWAECRNWALLNTTCFLNIDESYINKISPKICRSITLSTLHGCPPDEIERIALYLINEKHLNTFVKINPTILGYDVVRETMDSLGFGYLSFDDHHFKEDLQLKDAVPMIRTLQSSASNVGLSFGVKLTNTLPVDNPGNIMSGEEMYMSGRPLFLLTARTARILAKELNGKLYISWSGGADCTNISDLFRAGIWPVTMATTLLKPGGYNRFKQIAESFAETGNKVPDGISVELIDRLIQETEKNEWYRKHIKQSEVFLKKDKLPLFDCFIAPCSEGCPIDQDVPGYISLVGEHKYSEALELILDKNPLPFITGTICTHRCMSCCTRNHYEESVRIRDIKLKAAEEGYKTIVNKIRPPEMMSRTKVAVIGGGPAGLAAAYFLQRYGIGATVFEKSNKLGGIVEHIIPEFRISSDAVENDVKIISSMGAEFILNSEIKPVKELAEKGFNYVVIAVGAWKHVSLDISAQRSMYALDFLAAYKKDPQDLNLGKNVAVIGGGNTAMDAARAAKRVKGVENVSIIYRRTEEYMPAQEEELLLAKDDGVIFRELLAPISQEAGQLCCRTMTLGDRDESGRRLPVPTEEIISIPADSIIIAAGEKTDPDYFTSNSISVDEKGRVLSDIKTYETNIKGVFVAGDAKKGPATVVEAIADARAIADEILSRENLKIENEKNQTNRDIEKARSKKGKLLFSDSLEEEHKRCLDCLTVCENCVDVCPNRANISLFIEGSSTPQIIHIDDLCNECGNCTTFCPWAGEPYKDKFTYFSKEEDFNDSDNSGFTELDKGTFKIRYNGTIYISSFDSPEIELTNKTMHLIKAFMAHIPI